MRGLVAVVMGLGIATPGFAQEVAYRMDPAHTQATFSVDRFGFTSIMGVFAKSGGTVWLDESHPEKSRVDAWVTTDSVWSSDAERDRYVRGKDWLDAAANPMITFKSTRVVVTGKNVADATGDLIVFGRARPVTFRTRLNKIGPDIVTGRRAAGFSLETEIGRRDFGSNTAPSLIGDRVRIHIEALAERQN